MGFGQTAKGLWPELRSPVATKNITDHRRDTDVMGYLFVVL
jgi:hypothetical protein